ncbi:hypothetical protein D9M71_574030 [compost metagenome]
MADGGQAPAQLGGLHLACGTAQQAHLVVLLQGLDVPGHRRLADAQALGRAGETALADHRIESAELEQIHGNTISRTYSTDNDKRFE